MEGDKKRAAAAKEFAAFWQGKGYEKGMSQSFWLTLLKDVLGVDHPESIISFEDKVMIDHTSFIDGYIPTTKVLIEQKSLGKDLRAAIRQSDGSLLTPFQQAKRYSSELPYSERPRWIVTCNFAEFLVYDMEQPNAEPQAILLKDLGREYYRLNFLVSTGTEHLQREIEVSVGAGEIVGEIYDELQTQYGDTSPETLRSLNILCVRLVFCLYAEDAEIFAHNQFNDYLSQFNAESMRAALLQLFDTLNTPAEKRSRYLRPDLQAFPYTNGGLFAEQTEIPQFTPALRDLLLDKASRKFDWHDISPTIFGAVFESTLNPETRRKGGMHYTSIENIHKLIDPLFLNALKSELDEILQTKYERKRNELLRAFQDKLASLTFLDPACGSGNFLTETYLSLRRLENRAIEAMLCGERFNAELINPVKVSISQFYGIEVNDFAVTVATTALWISEAQMLRETERIVQADFDFLPLKTYANILEANALRTDWAAVIPAQKLSYIMGNPPFVGYSLQSKEQKDDMLSVFIDKNGKPLKSAGKIDYVAAWYYKSAQMMQGTNIRAALVSTNSITQGEQVAAIWKPMKEIFGAHIDFACRTFRWDSEASLKAHVHVVIIGFSCCKQTSPKIIYDNGQKMEAKNINAYLVDAPDAFVESRSKVLCDVPQMVYGNKPVDGGFLFLSEDERKQAIEKDKGLEKYIRQIYGSEEYINNKKRYCLWLLDVSSKEIREHPFIYDRVQKVRAYRLASPKKATQISADRPTVFQEVRQPNSNYIIVPRVSSERRRYVPMGFMPPEIIVNDSVQIIPNATLYHFGVLESNVHMAWMRVVCGRLKSDYRYSKDVVYNNFPWPKPTDEQCNRISQTAQAILDVRAKFPDSSLADLYDPVAMPYDLLQAHRHNDRAVMDAYGFTTKMTEPECVAALFALYQKIIGK